MSTNIKLSKVKNIKTLNKKNIITELDECDWILCGIKISMNLFDLQLEYHKKEQWLVMKTSSGCKDDSSLSPPFSTCPLANRLPL